MKNIFVKFCLIALILFIGFTDCYTKWESYPISDSLGARTTICLCNNNFVIDYSKTSNRDVGLLVSTDFGRSWRNKKLFNYRVDSAYITRLTCLGDSLYIQLYSGIKQWGIYLTTDYGETLIPRNNGIEWEGWEPVKLDNREYVFRILYIDSSEIYLASNSNFYRSTDGGENWINLSDSLPRKHPDIPFNVLSMAKRGDEILIVGYGHVAYSSDNGKSYELIYPKEWDGKGIIYERCAILGDYLFVYGNKSGVLRSSDKGKTWEQKNNGLKNLPLMGARVADLQAYKDYLFAVTDYEFPSRYIEVGLYISTDFGENWRKLNIDSNVSISSNPVFWGDTIYIVCLDYIEEIGSYRHYLFKARISELVDLLSVEEERGENFYIAESKPTPATTTATIRFYWDATDFDPTTANISIYDVYGNRISNRGDVQITPINNYSAEMVWDCSKYPTGVYFVVVNYLGNTRASKVVVVR